VDSILSTYLDAMNEPPLTTGDATAERYRLLQLGTFAPPVVVRVELSRDATAIAKTLVGAPVPGQRAALFDASRALGPTEVDWLRRLLDVADFWRMSSAFTREGLDGTVWILEGSRAGEHRVVYRWSPDVSERDYLTLCEYLLEIAPAVAIPEPTAEDIAAREHWSSQRERERIEREQRREEARVRSNAIATTLNEALMQGRALTCPHCRETTNQMRFVASRQDRESYFVCDRCKRSSSGLEITAAAG
jgi:hypothetical protein